MTEQGKLEKAIKGLECCMITSGSCKEDCPYRGQGDENEYCDEKIIKDVYALLKAQEPVKPVIEKNTSSGECEDPWGRLFFCGACGKRINEKYNPDEDDKYCKHCGQAVKWE